MRRPGFVREPEQAIQVSALGASENPLSLATRARTWGTVVSLPPVAVAWLLTGRPGLPWAGWLLALGSAFLELIYFITLSIAYRRGELSVVYPIARGTAPLLAVLVGLLLLGERLHAVALLGVMPAALLVRRPPHMPAAVSSGGMGGPELKAAVRRALRSRPFLVLWLATTG